MRIIAGELKNRRLSVPKSASIRPSTGHLREALFNILGDWIQGKQVLDLYAGTGAIGFEALSRGASHCTFVEYDRLVISQLRHHIAQLGVEKSSTVVATDVLQSLRLLSLRRFDLIFVDPPYGQSLDTLLSLLQMCDRGELIAPHGRLFVEQSRPPEGLPHFTTLRVVNMRRYGRTYLCEFERTC